MWLTAFLKPDFMTINTFRSEKLKDPTEEIFISTVKLLNRKNIVGTLKYTNYEKEIKRILKKKYSTLRTGCMTPNRRNTHVHAEIRFPTKRQ